MHDYKSKHFDFIEGKYTYHNQAIQAVWLHVSKGLLGGLRLTADLLFKNRYRLSVTNELPLDSGGLPMLPDINNIFDRLNDAIDRHEKESKAAEGNSYSSGAKHAGS